MKWSNRSNAESAVVLEQPPMLHELAAVAAGRQGNRTNKSNLLSMIPSADRLDLLRQQGLKAMLELDTLLHNWEAVSVVEWKTKAKKGAYHEARRYSSQRETDYATVSTKRSRRGRKLFAFDGTGSHEL